MSHPRELLTTALGGTIVHVAQSATTAASHPVALVDPAQEQAATATSRVAMINTGAIAQIARLRGVANGRS